MIDYLKQFDIIGLVETWSSFNGEFDSFLSGYCHFDCVRKRCNNSIRNSGGVSVFVKEEHVTSYLVSRIKHDLTDGVVLSVKGSVFHSMKHIILYNFYFTRRVTNIFEPIR